jgi:hypothetical protein
LQKLLHPTGHQAVVLTVEAPVEEEPLMRDKSVSGLTVSRFMFWSSLTRLSVLVEVEDEPLVADVCSAAVMSLTRVGLDFIRDALSAERRILYTVSVESDPELPVSAL